MAYSDQYVGYAVTDAMDFASALREMATLQQTEIDAAFPCGAPQCPIVTSRMPLLYRSSLIVYSRAQGATNGPLIHYCSSGWLDHVCALYVLCYGLPLTVSCVLQWRK